MNKETKSCKIVDNVILDGVCYSITYDEKNSALLLCDDSSKSLNIYKLTENNDISHENSQLVELQEWFQYPLIVGLYLNQIYVVGEFNGGIGEFDCDFNLKRKFGVEYSFGDLNSMAIDSHDGATYLYISHQNNKLSKWDCNKGLLVNELKVENPLSLKVKGDNLYVISESFLEIEIEDPSSRNKFKQIKSGENCVLVYKKHSFELIKRVSVENWIQPKGIEFDNFGNLMVTAFKLESDNFISIDRFLFLFDCNDNLINEVKMKDISSVLDMVLVKDNLFVISYEQEMFLLSKISFY
jgi:hypothetical protein